MRYLLTAPQPFIWIVASLIGRQHLATLRAASRRQTNICLRAFVHIVPVAGTRLGLTHCCGSGEGDSGSSLSAHMHVSLGLSSSWFPARSMPHTS